MAPDLPDGRRKQPDHGNAFHFSGLTYPGVGPEHSLAAVILVALNMWRRQTIETLEAFHTSRGLEGSCRPSKPATRLRTP